MQRMFYKCTSLTDFIGAETWDVSKVVNFEHMFSRSYKPIDVSKWNTASAENMYGMLSTTRTMREDKKYDVSNFKTSNVKYFGYMFKNVDNVEEFIGLENFDTSNGREFAHMFYSCDQLKTLNLISFDTTKAHIDSKEYTSANNSTLENCLQMFTESNKLESIVLGPKFNFNGDGTNTAALYKAVLPTPEGGYWYSSMVEKLTPSEIPDSRDSAVVYYNSPDKLTLSVRYSTLMDTANVIRQKLKTEDKILVADFPTKISEIIGVQLVTITQSEYDALVTEGTIDNEVYYCIAEE